MGLIKGVSVIVTYLYDLGTNLELFIGMIRRSNLLHTLKQWGIQIFLFLIINIDRMRPLRVFA